MPDKTTPVYPLYRATVVSYSKEAGAATTVIAESEMLGNIFEQVKKALLWGTHRVMIERTPKVVDARVPNQEAADCCWIGDRCLIHNPEDGQMDLGHKTAMETASAYPREGVPVTFEAMQFDGGLSSYGRIIAWAKSKGDTNALANEWRYSTPLLTFPAYDARFKGADPGDWIVWNGKGFDVWTRRS